MVEACAAAYKTTGIRKYRDAAHDAFAWYHGLNVQGLPVYHPENGGVGDAVMACGVNRNQGAESVLSYFLAALALDEIENL